CPGALVRPTPFSFAARDAKMQRTICVCPNIRRVKEVSRARAVNGAAAHGPLVATEIQCFGWRKYGRSSSVIDDCQSRHIRTDDGQGFCQLGRAVSGLYQQSRIVGSELG